VSERSTHGAPGALEKADLHSPPAVAVERSVAGNSIRLVADPETVPYAETLTGRVTAT